MRAARRICPHATSLPTWIRAACHAAAQKRNEDRISLTDRHNWGMIDAEVPYSGHASQSWRCARRSGSLRSARRLLPVHDRPMNIPAKHALEVDRAASAESLLRAACTRTADRAAWDRRLRRLATTDRQQQTAAVATRAGLTLLGLGAAPLGLVAVTGAPLEPVTMWNLLALTLLALLCLPGTFVWRRLARHRHHRLLRALHESGASMSRDAERWTLRDRATQVVLATLDRGRAADGAHHAGRGDQGAAA